MPLVFDGVSVEEIGEFAEVNEDLCRAFRQRDEAIQASPLRRAHNTQTGSATSPWEQIFTTETIWVPGWATELSAVDMFGVTVGGHTAHFRLRMNAIGGPEITSTFSSGSGELRELILPITTQAGGYHVLDVQSYSTVGAAARLWGPELLLTFRRS